MASYLVVKNGTKQKSYECKTTHSAKPYIKVNKTGYLDLTTNTTGFQAKIKHNNKVYRPLQVIHTTTTDIAKTSKTVYSGKYSYRYTDTVTSYSGYSYTGRYLTYQGSVYPVTSGRTYETSYTTYNYNTTNHIVAQPPAHNEYYVTWVNITTPVYITQAYTNSYYATSTEVGNLYNTTLATLSGTKLSTKNTTLEI